MTDRARVDFDHNSILKVVAAEVLGPLGLVQHGRSRAWIDDHGWWVIHVVFDPSGFGRGSYLRIATALLWEPFPAIPLAFEWKDRWKIPMGRFETSHINARRPDWWERDVRAFAAGAADYVRVLRAQPHDVRAFLALAATSRNGDYHIGVAAGLLRDLETSRASLRAVLRDSSSVAGDWRLSQRRAAEELNGLLDDQPAFLHAVASVVAAQRVVVKLPRLEVAEVVGQLEGALPRATTP
jgi:hypothetical protein